MITICTNCLNADIELGIAREVLDGPYWTTVHPGCCEDTFSQYEVVEVAE